MASPAELRWEAEGALFAAGSRQGNGTDADTILDWTLRIPLCFNGLDGFFGEKAVDMMGRNSYIGHGFSPGGIGGLA